MKNKNKSGILTLLVCASLGFTATFLSGCNVEGDTPLNYAELDKTIENAKDAKPSGIVTSADGNDVVMSFKWVTFSVMYTFNNAISAAESARNNAATQAQINKAVNDLKDAITVFINAIANGKLFVDTAVLQDLINDAKDLKDSVVVSSMNGSDVYQPAYWVTQAAMNAMDTALSYAEDAVLSGTNLDTVYNMLSTVITDFKAMMKNGTMAGYSVKFDSNGGSAVATAYCEIDDVIPEPAAPTKTGFNSKLTGWYKEETFINIWDFLTDIVTDNITLYAKWDSFSIGDIGPGTGTIFYVDSAGFTVEGYTGTLGSFTSYTAYYLEAAPSNSGTGYWGARGTLISDVTTFATADSTDLANPEHISNKIGNGRKDTMIIAEYLETIPETNRAAQRAIATTAGDKDDWFLPSFGELNLLYLQRTLPGINIPTQDYWSSSQCTANNAWEHRFSTDFRTNYSKDYNDYIRAIRAF